MTFRVFSTMLAFALGVAGSAAAAPHCPQPSVADSHAMSDAINHLRAQSGLGPVSADAALTLAAARQACEMARLNQMTHAGGGGVSARARQAGYRPSVAAENIAAGQLDASRVLSSWAASRGHRANLLHRQVRHVGIGQAIGADGRTRFWSLVLAAPR